MFHVELRRFPHVARAFNLTEAQLDERFVRPWVAGAPVELDERTWEPAKARLTIYESDEVRPDDMGLGRGWATVTRGGEEVTERVLEQARASVARFKEALARRGRTSLPDVVALTGESHPEARVSDRLALAERAVWELLHEGRLSLRGSRGPVARERWAPVLLRWESWSDAEFAVEPSGHDVGDQPAPLGGGGEQVAPDAE
jgi:hypothetical protein